jgi:hypothetical protein
MPTNINDATYFELRLVEEICLARRIPFKYAGDLELAKERTLQSHGNDAARKIEIQEVRLLSSLPALRSRISEIEQTGIGVLTRVDWVGGQQRGTRVADVDLWFGTARIPISVKSGGPGTERNLGSSKLQTLIGYSAKPEIDKMKSETLSSFQTWFPEIEFGASWNTIRSSIRGHEEEDVMRRIASKIGQNYQRIISGQIADAFRATTMRQKQDFVKYLALQNSAEDERLEIFIATNDGGTLKSVNNDLLGKNVTLEPDAKSDKGSLRVLVDGIPMWRINVNFTNGLGLSPLAIRVFSV